MIPRIWERHDCDAAAVERLGRELDVSPITARLLAIRGLTDPDAAKRFLEPSLDHLLDPGDERLHLPIQLIQVGARGQLDGRNVPTEQAGRILHADLEPLDRLAVAAGERRAQRLLLGHGGALEIERVEGHRTILALSD